MSKPFYIYVDVDETFVRSFSTKRIPMPNIIEHVRTLNEQGATLFCWSSGGAEYARLSASEFGIEDCFVGFLPKPNIILDDQCVTNWRNIKHVHPNETSRYELSGYRAHIANQKYET